MKRKQSASVLLLSLCSILFFQCSKKSDAPATGTLQGVVKNAVTSALLEGVSVSVFNADNNAPVGVVLKTDVNGSFSTQLVPGNYFVKFARQGFESVPSKSMEAVSFAVTAGASTINNAEMFPSALSNAGWITGKVVEGTAAVKGALVVATDEASGFSFSAISGEDGTFSIFNVSGGNFTLQAYLAGYNSSSVAAMVSPNTATTNVTVTMQKNASATLSGSIRNLAVDNLDVDITLVHPVTKETIPGLTTKTSGLNYSLSGIPNGTYIARATYKNDGRVMDPDRIAKFGEPVIVVSNGSSMPSTLTFDVTGSVTLNTPTNPSANTTPVEVATTKPTLQWTAYPSTSDYVVEMVDAATGAVVWGGFGKTADLTSKNITIPSNTTSIVYNSDGKAAIAELVPGKIYRWRIYASKNDQNSPTGWTLISASEDQQGLIRVAK